jgi:hypothetical protein
MALAWKAGWVNALRGSNPLSSADRDAGRARRRTVHDLSVQEPVPDPRQARSGQDLVEALRRWEEFGAVWRVLERDESQVTIGLFRCDGGEEVQRLVSTDAEVRAFVDGTPDV